MRLLIDTQILLWQVSDDPRLFSKLRSFLTEENNEIIVSDVTIWEIVIKHGTGKLDVDVNGIEWVIARDRYVRLAILRSHIHAVADLPKVHRDPFDRLLIAQAIFENLPLLTSDPKFAAYPVRLAVE